MGALIAKKLVNWQSLQERLDLFAVYRLIHLHEQNKGPPPMCSYEKKYIKVHRSIEEQVNFEILILLDSNYIKSYGISLQFNFFPKLRCLLNMLNNIVETIGGTN